MFAGVVLAEKSGRRCPTSEDDAGDVAILSRNVQEGGKLAEAVRTSGGKAVVFECDIGKPI